MGILYWMRLHCICFTIWLIWWYAYRYWKLSHYSTIILRMYFRGLNCYFIIIFNIVIYFIFENFTHNVTMYDSLVWFHFNRIISFLFILWGMRISDIIWLIIVIITVHLRMKIINNSMINLFCRIKGFNIHSNKIW